MGKKQDSGLKFASYWVKYLFPFLSKKDKVLDIGAGQGYTTKLLNEKYKIKTTAIDIQKSRRPAPHVKIILYDGKKIPFGDNAFDVSILRAILHHCQNPEELLLEARRVTKKRIFIFEDIYENTWEKLITFFFDSLANIFISGLSINTFRHPHKNRTFKEWLKTFHRLDLEVEHSQEWHDYIWRLPIRWHFAFFVLKKQDAN